MQEKKMCVKCEGTNNICSLIRRAILVISADERESVAYSERRVNPAWLGELV